MENSLCLWSLCMLYIVCGSVSRQVNSHELVWVLGSVELYLLRTVVCVFILSPGPLGVYVVGGNVS